MLHNLPKMVSCGVASATYPVGIGCGGVSTGCESGGASFGSEFGGASAGSESGRASAGSATVGTLAVGDVAGPASTCWSDTLRPQLGLADAESVLHGGALHEPVFLNGSDQCGRSVRVRVSYISTSISPKTNTIRHATYWFNRSVD